MTTPRDDIDARIRRRPRPGLPPDLRRRVMTTAVLAPAATSWRDRAWFSRTWRLAAAATLLALVALDHWVAGSNPASGHLAGRAPVGDASIAVGLGAGLDVPADLVQQLASRVEFSSLTAREPRGLVAPAPR
jgi:hypothetical protein